MQQVRFVGVALVALSATGCLATKGDIRLLQDELKATRASVARSDSARRATGDSLAAAIAALAASQARTSQSLQQTQQKTAADLGALSSRVSSSDINTKEQLKSLGDDLDQVRELSRQNARSVSAARAQVEQNRPVATPPDSGTVPATTVPSGVPSPSVLFATGRSQIIQGSCTTARRSFQDVVANYPDSFEAPEAQYQVAESYMACDPANPVKADSVYRVVTEKYPKTDFAAISLYKRAEMLRKDSKADAAKPLYQRIVCEYRTSTVYSQALDRLGGTRPVCR